MQKRLKTNYEYYEVTPFKDLRGALELGMKNCEGRPAIMYKKPGETEPTSVSYPEFMTTCNELGTGLYKLGLAGGHMAILGENCYKWVHCYYTGIMGDFVIVPVDRLLPADELVNVLNRSDSTFIFVTKEYEKVIMDNLEKLPNIKHVFFLDDDENTPAENSYTKLCADGKAALEAGDTSYTSYEIEDEKLKLLVFTSGTTGTSKGVMLSHHNIASIVYYGRQVADILTRCLSVLPYNHTYEAVCGILVTLNKGATLCINENIRTVAKNLKYYKPDYIYLVPLFVETLYKNVWMKAEQSGKADTLRKGIKISNALLKVGIDVRKKLFKDVLDGFGGNLQKIVCGGAPIRAEVGEFFEAMGISLTNGYGITECSPLVSVNRERFYDFVSAGVPMPCVDVKIDEPNEDGEGEILVKGDNVMMGYYKNPEATKEVLSEDGWFRTGDYGKIDELSRVYITGRKKNMIVLRNGKNVYPEEIEDYLMGLPIVSEVIVSAVLNEHGEETALKAEIYPEETYIKDKSDEETYEAVKKAVDELNKKLPAYKNILKVIIKKEPFEKTTSRKIKRNYNK